MTKYASAFKTYPDAAYRVAPITAHAGQGVDEQELSNWAAQSTIAASEKSGTGRAGTVAFWVVVAALLAVRFFVVDPAKLRPVETSSSSSIVVSQQTSH